MFKGNAGQLKKSNEINLKKRNSSSQQGGHFPPLKKQNSVTAEFDTYTITNTLRWSRISYNISEKLNLEETLEDLEWFLKNTPKDKVIDVVQSILNSQHTTIFRKFLKILNDNNLNYIEIYLKSTSKDEIEQRVQAFFYMWFIEALLDDPKTVSKLIVLAHRDGKLLSALRQCTEHVDLPLRRNNVGLKTKVIDLIKRLKEVTLTDDASTVSLETEPADFTVDDNGVGSSTLQSISEAFDWQLENIISTSVTENPECASQQLNSELIDQTDAITSQKVESYKSTVSSKVDTSEKPFVYDGFSNIKIHEYLNSGYEKIVSTSEQKESNEKLLSNAFNVVYLHQSPSTENNDPLKIESDEDLKQALKDPINISASEIYKPLLSDDMYVKITVKSENIYAYMTANIRSKDFKSKTGIHTLSRGKSFTASLEKYENWLNSSPKEEEIKIHQNKS